MLLHHQAPQRGCQLGTNPVLGGLLCSPVWDKSESTSAPQTPAQVRMDLEPSLRSPPPGSLPWYPPALPPDFGGNGVSGGSRVTRAGQVPEAEVRHTSGAQRAAMLEQRRRRRGASWVPAAAPVGWGHGPSRAAEGPSARRRGGWAGRPALSRPAPSTGLAKTPPTPLPLAQRPHPGAARPVGLAPLAPPAPRVSLPPRSLLLSAAQAPGTRTPRPMALICPHPSPPCMRPLPSPIFHQLPCRPRGHV